MEKFYQAWALGRDGSLGLIADASTEEDCKARAIEHIDKQVISEEEQDKKPVEVYVFLATPILKVDLTPKWEKV